MTFEAKLCRALFFQGRSRAFGEKPKPRYMNTRKLTRKLLLALGCVLILSGNFQGQTKPSGPAPAGDKSQKGVPEPGASSAQKYFTDVELINQNGEKMRFYSDLLKGRTVVIIPFFATCTAVCPPMNATMRRIQQELGERVGKQIYLISISVDPATDTPERLKEYAKKFSAGAGWYFLTGKLENVNLALYKLGQYVADKNQHSAIMIIGNEATGSWTKAYALGRPSELIKVIEGVANDKAKD
jgi:protein SCO1/2